MRAVDGGVKSNFLWEKVFAVTGLLFSTNAVVFLMRKESGAVFDPAKGDIVMLALWFVIYLITLFLLTMRLRQGVRVAFNDKLLWLLIGLALASILWSEAPTVTLRRGLALMGTTAFGIYLAACYTRRELLKMLVWALGLSAVLSLLLGWLFPLCGIHQDAYHSGAWRGIYVHKNTLGCFMALAAVTLLIYPYRGLMGRAVGLCFFVMSIMLLFLSKSMTALIVLFVLLFLILLYSACLRFNRVVCFFILISIIIAVGCSVIWLVNNWGILWTFLGRDGTLSGRTMLWQVLWDMNRQHFWQGCGYGAFWLNWKEPSGYVWYMFSWEPSNAHNGYLDLWLQLGLVGLAIFMLSLSVNLLKAFAVLRKNGSLEKIFPLMFFVFLALNNITESSFLVQNSLFWVLYVAVSIQLRAKSPIKKQRRKIAGG